MTTLIAEQLVEFERTDDVIVVGLGGAGVSAALEAANCDASVHAIERASGTGGSTALAGGYIYLGGGTSIQIANGYHDTVEDMYDFLCATTCTPDFAKIRAYCDGSVAHFEWLKAQGVPFNDRFFGEKFFEHPTQDSLAWTGDEKTWPYCAVANPFPRGHRADAPSGHGGAALMASLTARAEASSYITLTYDSRVTNLVIDHRGAVCGVEVKSFGKTSYYGARGGVILSTGGFGMNWDMLKQLCPELTRPGIEIIGTSNSDGSGHQLGLAAGAQLQFSDACFVTSPIYPPASLLEGILVNAQGQRFVSEDSYHGRTTAAMLRQPGQKCWLICDVDSFDRPLMGQQLVNAWDNVADMERDLGIEGGNLGRTIDQYNQFTAQGHDPDFHKSPEYLRPIDKMPFAALDCSLGAAPFPGFTLGGLRTNVTGQVLRSDGQVVAGLFAAGAVAANIAAAQGGDNYASGTSIGESTFFGRQCGRFAAALVDAKPPIALF